MTANQESKKNERLTPAQAALIVQQYACSVIKIIYWVVVTVSFGAIGFGVLFIVWWALQQIRKALGI